MAALPSQARRRAGWAHLAIGLWQLGLLRLQPRAKQRDPTLGFPGEGPRQNFLTRAAYERPTRREYDSGVALFVAWMDEHGEEPVSVAELDEALTEFFHDLYLEKGGHCRTCAESALSGITMRFPH